MLTNESFVSALGALTGNQAMQQVKGLAVDLLIGLAGPGATQCGGENVSRPVLYP